MYLIFFPVQNLNFRLMPQNLPDFIMDKVAIFRAFFLNNGIYHPVSSLYNQAYKPYCRKNTTRNCRPEKYTDTTKDYNFNRNKILCCYTELHCFSVINIIKLLHTPRRQSLRCANIYQVYVVSTKHHTKYIESLLINISLPI